MDRVYESGAVAGAPAAPAAPSTGYPTNGNPAGGIEATWPGAYWFHMITEELRAVITAAGLVPDHTNLGQLLAALQGGFGLPKSIGNSGYLKLPGGLFIQWGGGSTVSGVVSIIFPLAWANTNYRIVSIHSGSGPAIVYELSANRTVSGTSLRLVTDSGVDSIDGSIVHWIAVGVA